jgi:hypothetical protein
MSLTVSVKPTATLTEHCSQCGLWFEFLHPGPDRPEGVNRAVRAW